MAFRTRDVMTDENTQPVASVNTEPETIETDLGHRAADEAIRVIQKHVDKEARNRWVEHLEVRDLCPRQKADLVADLARLF